MGSELQDFSELNPIHRASQVNDGDSEYWEFLLMLGFGDPLKTEQLYKSLRSKIPSGDWRMPLVEIGEARILSISGRHFESHVRLQTASDLIFSHSNYLNDKIQAEITALYYYVLTFHDEKIAHQNFSLPFLLIGKELTAIDSFKLAFNYRISVFHTKWRNQPVSNILSDIQKLEESGLWILATIGYRVAAIMSRVRKDYAAAHRFYRTAFSIAHRKNLKIQIKQLHTTRGYALYCEERLDEAEVEYAKINIEGELDPVQPILNENLALLAESRNDFDTSISLIKRAISVSTMLDSIPYLPGELLHLGQTYENHYKDLDQAENYYKLGYDHAMRYAGHGISLTGDRKAVVDAYVNLINKKRGSKVPSKVAKPVDHFAFSQGKPWKEIKDIFHHQLICYHQNTIQNSKALAKKLAMPASTLYSIQDRLRKRGYELPDKNSPNDTGDGNLFNFIEEHEDLTWEAINGIFEREIIHYLYEKYGYNKLRMAQVLKLSYPSIITKTRELTEVNEHLLPN